MEEKIRLTAKEVAMLTPEERRSGKYAFTDAHEAWLYRTSFDIGESVVVGHVEFTPEEEERITKEIEAYKERAKLREKGLKKLREMGYKI